MNALKMSSPERIDDKLKGEFNLLVIVKFNIFD